MLGWMHICSFGLLIRHSHFIAWKSEDHKETAACQLNSSSYMELCFQDEEEEEAEVWIDLIDFFTKPPEKYLAY